MGIPIPKQIKITGDFQKSSLKVEAYVEEIPVGASPLKGNLLQKMFARKMIQDLEEQEAEDSAEVKDEITRLAEKYQLLSKYTSFVAVDSKENKSSLAMKSRSVPNQIPIGFPVPAYQTASAFSVGGFSSYESYIYYDNYYDGESYISNSVSNSTNESYDYYHDYYDGESYISSSVSNSTPQSPIDQVIELISLQTTQGYFTKSNKIFEILELAEKDLVRMAGGTDDKTFYTLLVVTALEERYKDLKPSWELIGEKAEKYLMKQQVPDFLKQKIVSLFQNI